MVNFPWTKPRNVPPHFRCFVSKSLPGRQVEIRVRDGQVVGESGGVGEVVLAVVAVPVRLVPVEPLALPRVLRFAESPGKGARKPNQKTNYLQNSRIYRVTMVV